MNKFAEATNISTCECIVNDNFQNVTTCLVCGEEVAVNMFEPQLIICDKCRKAILYVRDHLEDINK